ncbi:MAG: chromate resistance protein ChrB domain-containing protein [Rhodospirillaceae bacterium]
MSSISVQELRQSLDTASPPLVIDVRRSGDYLASGVTVTGALRRDPDAVDSWATELPAASRVVAYCAHGRSASQGVAAALSSCGINASYLEGGLETWQTASGAIDHKPIGGPSRWVTREHPKIDRIACPWLIRRFIEREAELLYVSTPHVRETAAARDAIPYDIPDVHFSHEGEKCSFDTFLRHYRLQDPALQQLAVIIRGADTAKLDIAPQAAGLAAISLGLSRNCPDDHEMLRHGMVIYDALYTWCKEGQDELHTWNPKAYA